MALLRMHPVRALRLSFNCCLETMVSSIHPKIWPAVFDGYTSDSPNLLGEFNFGKISRSSVEWLRIGVNFRNQSFNLLVHARYGNRRQRSAIAGPAKPQLWPLRYARLDIRRIRRAPLDALLPIPYTTAQMNSFEQ